MNIFNIMDLIMSVREGDLPLADEAAQTIAHLQAELGAQLPTTASEAFLMAAELTHMLESRGADESNVAIARALTEGLMLQSKLEIGEIGQLEKAIVH